MAKPKKIDRPFDPDIWRRASELARQYQIVMHFEDGEWYGRALEMPLVMSDGPSPEACVDHTREAITLGIATLLEKGKRPPAPAGEGVRTEQVNIRLSAEEKLRLEYAAKRHGYKGLADYLRAAGLKQAG